ncbi:MAG: metallophosphoesterase [Traorella sp.]
MIYVMSDIHGCYQEYLKALELIHFSDEDELFVLGDVIDRGNEPIALLKDMSMRANVFPLIGNHEYMALTVLRKLCVEINEDNVETHLNEEDMANYYHWMNDGGDVTLKQFQKLSREDQEDLLDYLDEFSLYEEIEVNGRSYILVHAGLNHFSVDKKMEDYQIEEVIFKSVDYSIQYFKDKYLVTGHKPTISIDKSKKGQIIEKNHHIAIDCGCVFGMNLGVICLDTLEKWYVSKIN